MTTINLTNGTEADVKWIEKNVPKKYWEAIDAIERGGIDGWWLHLKDGFVSTATDTHQLHEDTAAELKKQFKTIVAEPVEEVEAAEQTEEVAAEQTEEVAAEQTEEAAPEADAEIEWLLDLAAKAVTEDEKDFVRLAMFNDEALHDIVRRSQKTLKHIATHLESDFLRSMIQNPAEWEDRRQKAERNLRFAQNELERRGGGSK